MEITLNAAVGDRHHCVAGSGVSQSADVAVLVQDDGLGLERGRDRSREMRIGRDVEDDVGNALAVAASPGENGGEEGRHGAEHRRQDGGQGAQGAWLVGRTEH